MLSRFAPIHHRVFAGVAVAGLIGAAATVASSSSSAVRVSASEKRETMETATAQQKRPNIIYILADDLGGADAGFNGATEIKTPNLDKLAASGATLKSFYVQPVCSPTRAALMTGRYPMRHGLQVGVVRPWAKYGLPLEERTLPQALRESGYETSICGKWHLGHFTPEYLPTRRGFEHQYGHYNGALDYFTHVRDGGFDWHRDDKVNRDAGYSTHLVGQEAVKRIKQRDRSRPFFLYVPFNAVHTPLQVPPKYKEPYANLKPRRQTYAGMIAAMDEEVGRIAAAVQAENLQNDTLIIFSSDNGGPDPGRLTDNGPLRAGKGTVYEGGVRVAAFATWAGHIKPGSVVNEPLHIVDWYPTLLQLGGASLKQKLPLDGKDLWATLTDGKPSPHDAILLNTAPGGGTVRMGDWKLVIGGKGANQQEDEPDNSGGAPSEMAASVELFNLREDLGERVNLADKEPERVKTMRARYEAFARQAVPPKARPQPADYKAPKIWGEAE